MPAPLNAAELANLVLLQDIIVGILSIASLLVGVYVVRKGAAFILDAVHDKKTVRTESRLLKEIVAQRDKDYWGD